jgi:Na+-driven multidrug efflux pump
VTQDKTGKTIAKEGTVAFGDDIGVVTGNNADEGVTGIWLIQVSSSVFAHNAEVIYIRRKKKKKKKKKKKSK